MILEINITNRFTKDAVVKVTLPYDHYKVASGYYSKKHSRLVANMANVERVPKDHIAITYTKKEGKTDRVFYEFPSGIKLDVPHDADAYDYSIIKKQLEVMMMRFERPSKTN